MQKIKKIFLIILMFYVQNVFSQKIDDTYIISSIKISGNKITKSKIILRELTFKIGDSISEKRFINEIKNSEQNLLKTPLFNSVKINYAFAEKNINIDILVEERWYLWPQFVLTYADQNFSNWLHEKDFTRTDFGVGIINYNTRGRDEKISSMLVWGYNRTLSLSYSDLYLDKKRQHSLSTTFLYLKRKETSYDVVNNKVMQVKLYDDYAMKTYIGRISYQFRKSHNSRHIITSGYENRTINDTILKLNSLYFNELKNNAQFFYSKYVYIYDTRNSRIFPLRGNYFKAKFQKNGLYILKNNPINFAFINIKYSKFIELNSRIYLANNIDIKKSFGKTQAYFLQSAIGKSANIRGYEYYMINGEDYYLSNNTINFVILPKKIFHFKFIPLPRFNKIPLTIIASTYFDATYVNSSQKNNNELANQLVYSAGVGLNFITYYDKLLRVEYSINKQKEHGVYIHFEYPF